MLRALLGALVALCAQCAIAAPSVAFFYGETPPLDELRAFDIAVLEPGHLPDPRAASVGETQLLAYVSVGEVLPSRPYFADIPAAWKAGENKAWGSVVVDQSHPDWPRFFAERVIGPLWRAGWRGFFLDTLDSYRIVFHSESRLREQQAGLVRVIAEIARAYPGVRLMLNRGFELLPGVHEQVFAVAAESLFQGWDPQRRSYRPVREADRAWLLGQLAAVRDTWGLLPVAIDYVAPGERALARETAARIAASGVVPWVTDSDLVSLGVGEVEAMPRKVLMVFTGTNEYTLPNHEILRYAAMPLNYLGYVPEYLDVSRGSLPEATLAGRYAGVVLWFRGGENGGPGLEAWVRQQVKDGVPVAVINDFGFRPSAATLAALGLKSGPSPAGPGRLRVIERHPAVGFEVEPFPDRGAFRPLTVMGGEPWLTAESERGERMHGIALAPWGGYALFPYAVAALPGGRYQRWVVDPIEFLRQALRLPAMPVPDVTTENGLRLLMAHVDGDGFPSRAELPGAPFAGEVMLRDVLERYRIPTTVSVIQGEIAADGIHPQHSAALEAIARRVFALPHVEPASHSYSHPFFWHIEEGAATGGAYTLPIPGYRFDPRREVVDSLDYVNRSLLPPGKHAKLFLWTGDCSPDGDTIALAYAAGVLNMNGGDTVITRSDRSLTRVAPLGVPKGGWFQVFAPNQNENVYTNNWTGPFYGYERAIETFELTDAPRRLKPVDIYYHTYSASKRASLAALHKVYDWALAQPAMPVHVSEYAQKVLDFNHVAVSRTPQGWRVRGAGTLRTLRAPAALGQADLAASTGVLGHSLHNGETYLHLAGGEALVAFAPQPAARPFVAEANGRIDDWQPAPNGFSFSIASHVPARFALGEATGCTVRVDGRVVSGKAGAGGRVRFELMEHGSHAVRVSCTAGAR